MEEEKRQKFRFTIEPILLGVVFAVGQTEGDITDLFLRQACYYEGYSVENCTGEHQSAAQKRVSYIETWKLLIETVFPSILSFFSGPWSNENGRKIILTSSIIGYTLYFASWGILSLIKDLNPAFFLLCSLPLGLSGGMVGMLLSCFCYIADITSPQYRALRLGIVELVINLAMLAGYLCCPYIVKIIPNTFWLPFLINTSILVFCLIYTIFFLPESIELKPDRNTTFFRLDHLKMTFKTMIKKRENYSRAIIFISILLSFLNLLTVFGEGPIKYLSLIRAFQWNIDDYTLYNAISLLLLALISTFGLVVCHRILKMPENLILLITFVTKSLSGYLMAVATTPSFFYFATIVGSLRGVIGPLVKSIVSHIISPDEVGVLFSFFSSVECLTPQIAVPIYNSIYAALVSTAPLDIYFITFTLYGVGVFAIILNIFFMRSQKEPEKVPVGDSVENILENSRS